MCDVPFIYLLILDQCPTSLLNQKHLLPSQAIMFQTISSESFRILLLLLIFLFFQEMIIIICVAYVQMFSILKQNKTNKHSNKNFLCFL